MRWLTSLAVAGLAACGADDRPLTFGLTVNDYSSGAVAITVDGEPLLVTNQRGHRDVDFANLADADARPIVIQTWRDGVVVDECRLYADACRGECFDARPTGSVCIDGAGGIGLNTWDCRCSSSVADWFCDGDCADTAP